MDVAATAGISTALLSPLVQTEASQEEGGLEEERGLKHINIVEFSPGLAIALPQSQPRHRYRMIVEQAGR